MGDQQRRPGAGVPVSATRIIDAAREAVRQLEPEELVVFDGVAESWLSGDLPGRGREPGAAVGFGVEAVLLSELLFPIITGALGQVLGTPITERLHHGRRAGRRTAAPTAAGDSAGDSPGERAAAGPALTTEQLRDIHNVCQRDAAASGMTPARAALLADAVVGALAASPGQADS